VSGGADSMCLAYLFKRLQEQNISPPLDLTAFIIDHKARHDSTVEAHSVSKLLAQLGSFYSETTTLHVVLITPRRSQVRNPYHKMARESATVVSAQLRNSGAA
jgi:tRNA(Ile)-lysidine synthase TilS/MesJ